MKRILPLLAALLAPTAAAHAFSGEDPVFGHPWYHAQITREAAKATQRGWTFNSQKDAPDVPLANIALEIANLVKDDPRRGGDGAAEAIAWHADFLDSYLYSPLWWATGKDKDGKNGPEGILKRYKVSRAIEAELKACHFDDLNSTAQVNAMWRRYASGTFAGLMWAAEQNGGQGDVFAAQNILGASLHAVADFYSHSSWIDAPQRRQLTYFEVPRAGRANTNLFTGAYETNHQLGVKPHGRWVPKDQIWGQPGVKQVMEVACDPLSPFSNSPECEAYKAIKAGTQVQTSTGGLPLPPSLTAYTPAGIALDNKWVADEAVRQRGLDITGAQAFGYAHELAVRHSTQWLLSMESAMEKAGKKAFWDKVKTTPASDEERIAQYENYGQFPFLFLAAGSNPPKNGAEEEWFLRVKLRTADEDNAGTDSDIRVKVGDQKFLLDYLPKANPVLAYNDFERGDNDAYIVGPLAQCPDKIELINDAASVKELVQAAGRDFVNGVKDTVDSVGNALLTLVAGHADKIAVNKQLWMPEDLAAIPVGAPGRGFQIALNGGKEGNYEAHGTIFKVAQDEENYSFEVHLDSLKCITESTWDRGSNSDEPFLLSALNPLPGDQEAWLSPVYADVDKGEQPKIGHGFTRITVPKASGMLNLALTLMESDDETGKAREELLAKFAGTYRDKTEGAKRTFDQALATTLAANWKLGAVEVVAWSRNGQVRQGTVLRQNANRWIEAGKSVTLPLDVGAARDTGVSTDDLLPELLPANPPTNPTTPTNPGVPTNPGIPTTPTTPIPSPPSFDLTTWVDEWDTTYGRVKLELQGGILRGRLYIASEVAGLEKESDRLELSAGNAAGELVGKSIYTGTEQPIFMRLSADGNSFSGTSGRPGNIGQWSGKRRRQTPPTPTQPTIPGVPSTPTVPVVTTPTIPTTPTVPVVTPPSIPTTPTIPTPTVPTTPTTGTGAAGGFRPLGDWAIQIESMRVARDNQIEVVASFKNTQRNRATLGAGDITLIATDADGVGFKNIGNLYRASGDPDMQPEKLAGSISLESAAQGRVLFLFDIPEGATPLKTLTVTANRAKPLTFNIAGLTLPESAPTVSFPIAGTVGGTADFADFAEFGVRFDGVRRGPNGALQVFLTTQNRDIAQFRSHPGFSLDVAVIDQDGLTLKDEGNLYRATSNGPALQKISHNVSLVIGGQATLVYPVPMSKTTIPKRLILQYRDKKLTIDLPAVP